jgi:UTP--glucose-1-phosphate uridylyltransferase
MLGLGHAILTGEALIGNQSFAVLLADDLCDDSQNGVLSQMTKIYDQYKCSVVAIEEIPLHNSEKYGIIAGYPYEDNKKIFQITDMVEKPSQKNAPSNLAIIGRYILTPDIFDILKNIKPDNTGEIQITNALNVQAKQGKVIGYKFSGKRFDCGSIEGFVEATNHYAKNLNLI